MATNEPSATGGKPVRSDLLAAAAVAAVVAAVAATCRAPGVLFADAGELLTAIATGGVAHPPGFPLYLVLGGLFLDATRFLGGTDASRLNLFSSLADGVVAGTVTLAAALLLDRVALRPAPVARGLFAAAAGLLAGFGPTLFDFSLGIEVYALHAVFVAAALAFALAPPTRRHAALCGLAAGGGLAVHHVTMVVILPGLALLLWGDDGRKERLRRAGLFALALLPGLASYAVLPIRALRKPSFNWGDPSNAFRFWQHVSAQIYQVNIESSFAAISAHAERFLEAFRAEVTLGGIAIALIAALVLFRRGTFTGAGLLLVAAGDIAFAVRYEIAEDQAAYYIPTFLVTSLLVVAAAAWIAARVPRAGTAIAAATLVATGALSVAHVRERALRREDARAPEIARNFLASLPPGALALTADWNVYAPTRAALDVEKARPDVLVLDLLLLRRGWYLDTFAQRNPARLAEARAEFDVYRKQLAAWEEGRPYDADELTRVYNDFTRKLVTAAFARRAPAVWIGTVMSENLPTGAGLIPSGIGYRILPSRAETATYVEDAPVETRFAARRDLPLDDTFEKKIRSLYSGMRTQRALYELAFGKRDRADRAIALARDINPGNPETAEVAADLAAQDGDAAKALDLYAEALRNGGDAARIGEKSRRLSSPSTTPGTP